jgi:hypothetical protein
MSIKIDHSPVNGHPAITLTQYVPPQTSSRERVGLNPPTGARLQAINYLEVGPIPGSLYVSVQEWPKQTPPRGGAINLDREAALELSEWLERQAVAWAEADSVG